MQGSAEFIRKDLRLGQAVTARLKNAVPCDAERLFVENLLKTGVFFTSKPFSRLFPTAGRLRK